MSINAKQEDLEGVCIPNSAEPGSSAVVRAPTAIQHLADVSPLTGAASVYDNFQTTVHRRPNAPFLGHRPFDPASNSHKPFYQWQTYEEIAKRVHDFGSGLQHLITPESVKGLPTDSWCPKFPWYNIGIYSVNRPEWVITDLATSFYGCVSVALYDTLGPETVEFIINHAEIPVVVCAAQCIPNLLRADAPHLRVIVSMDEWWWPLDDYNLSPTAQVLLQNAKAAGVEDLPNPRQGPHEVPSPQAILKHWAETKGIKLMTFSQIEEIGREHPAPHRPSSADELYTICYTSGTTGTPKGAMLTHRNFISEATLAANAFIAPRPDDVYISYLPAAHCFERSLIHTMIGGACAIGFYRGDSLGLLEDMGILKPTIFISVPRLYNRIYERIRAATVTAGGIKGALFNRAVREKMDSLLSHGPYHAFWDRLLFNKVRQVLGGRVRFMVTGSAPIGKDVLQFLRIMFCAELVEGFGQTESSAGSTIARPGDYSTGHVGIPLPCNELKVVDVPEMKYFVTDKPYPRGEVCIRGVNVFKGYWKDPEKTRETLDEKQWLHTGDIGMFVEGQRLRIIDRKKNIFKLSQGEYVAPEKVENIYVQCPLVGQAWVHGDSLQPFLVGVVVPNMDNFPRFVRKVMGDPKAEAATHCNDAKVRKALLDEMNAVGRKRKLNGYEMIKNVHVDLEPLTPDRGLVTPTFKLKRPQLKEFFQTEIDRLYAEVDKTDAKL